MNHQLLSLAKRPPSLRLGDLPCYISFLLVHPPPTLVSHPCPYLSAHLIDHSFRRFVSSCGPERTVQGSRPHKWGQGVSWGYLIRRWQLLLGLLFYYVPMAGPLGSELLWDARRDCLWRRGAFPFCDFGLPRTGSSSTVYPDSLDSLCSSSGISSSLACALGLIWNGFGFAKSFSPTIASQNPTARLFGWRGGFWCSRAYVMADWVLFPYGRQGLFTCPRYAPGVSAYEVHCH